MDTGAAAGDQSMPQALAERTLEESREGGQAQKSEMLLLHRITEDHCTQKRR